jgi:ribosomal-protein-alanine N-acetyltransferase
MADTFVLRKKQLVIGFAVLVLVADQAELHNIAIHPDRQGQGLGGTFLRALIQSAPAAIKAFYLEVRVTNYRALRLYQSLGFAEIGRRPDYYSNNFGREDAVVMGRERTFPN